MKNFGDVKLLIINDGINALEKVKMKKYWTLSSNKFFRWKMKFVFINL